VSNDVEEYDDSNNVISMMRRLCHVVSRFSNIVTANAANFENVRSDLDLIRQTQRDVGAAVSDMDQKLKSIFPGNLPMSVEIKSILDNDRSCDSQLQPLSSEYNYSYDFDPSKDTSFMDFGALTGPHANDCFSTIFETEIHRRQTKDVSTEKRSVVVVDYDVLQQPQQSEASNYDSSKIIDFDAFSTNLDRFFYKKNRRVATVNSSSSDIVKNQQNAVISQRSFADSGIPNRQTEFIAEKVVEKPVQPAVAYGSPPPVTIITPPTSSLHATTNQTNIVDPHDHIMKTINAFKEKNNQSISTLHPTTISKFTTNWNYAHAVRSTGMQQNVNDNANTSGPVQILQEPPPPVNILFPQPIKNNVEICNSGVHNSTSQVQPPVRNVGSAVEDSSRSSQYSFNMFRTPHSYHGHFQTTPHHNNVLPSTQNNANPLHFSTDLISGDDIFDMANSHRF